MINEGSLKDAFAYVTRLEYELGVYDTSGYSGIILIIADYINWARQNGVVVGPGRGSAAGSLVVYLAGITTIDPMKFGLIFERFLNPSRVSLPDIDTDFSSRDAVIGYLKKKYGENRVVKVGVPSLFKPRSAIDEFARELGIHFNDAKTINKMVGDSTNFKDAFEAVPELDAYRQQYPELFALAEKAQGYVRMTTTHPSAVILTGTPIGCEIPLQRARGEKEDLVTQWDGEELDKVGFVKLDILTVDNLRIISNSITMLGEGSGIDFYNLPLDNKRTLDGFKRGETVGVFQLEEPKSVGILQGLDNVTFEDVCAVNACIRPGLDVAQFIHAHNDASLITYDVPEVEHILSETYGVILYQEQVMQIMRDLGGFTMAESDVVRKIIAKTANQRSKEGLTPTHDKFKAGYKERGLDPNQFDQLWAHILSCQNYIFNKAHATCYGYIAYADMYLKQHYPLQFMCACLQTRSREIYIKECERMGIEILPPDVNTSGVNYQIEGNAIRMGLGNIKFVGKATKVIANRPYRDRYEFLAKAKPTKKIMEALAYGGALDCFDERATITFVMCDIDVIPTMGSLAMKEKEYLGFYLMNNPLGGLEEELKGTVTPETRQPQRAAVGGMITRIKTHEAKTGTMAFVTLLTQDGEMDCIVWPSDYATEKSKIVESNLVIGRGRKTDKGNYSMKNLRVITRAE
jgi:DNA polymerase-3 subunit alpha